jgi:hypothetical protein
MSRRVRRGIWIKQEATTREKIQDNFKKRAKFICIHQGFEKGD